ncbi:MAG TPA: class I SAM-dependent methyltransferase, partial [Elusimicrobiales bacterium]|nr:class I SAM-dependent methyltransferase [Elusimicrobiales bacterium]
VEHATRNFGSDKIKFQLSDAMNVPFEDQSFDVINCSHVYEHVPDSARLLAEIRRLLKPGGVCFFSAGNRLILMEGHYKLPFLSVIPKFSAHWYLRLLGKGDFYYENHLTLWGLRKLVSGLEIVDYTHRVIAEPAKFHAEEMVRDGSFTQKALLTLWPMVYWLCPTYIWLLRKPIGGAK